MPQFAANLTMMFNEVPFPERFQRAARSGFMAVEFLFPYEYPVEDLERWLKENGLVNALFNMPPGNFSGGERGIACLPGRQDEFREGVRQALRYASRLGTPTLHAMAGLIPPNASRAECRAVYVDNLKFAANELAKQGKSLVIEPINLRDIPGYFLNRQAEAHDIRCEVGAPNLKVQMDLYHAQIVEGDLSATLKQYIDGIGHIQIASVPERHEPDEGEINYRHVLHLLDALGYEGWVGCEYRPRGRTEDGLGWLEEYS